MACKPGCVLTWGMKAAVMPGPPRRLNQNLGGRRRGRWGGGEGRPGQGFLLLQFVLEIVAFSQDILWVEQEEALVAEVQIMEPVFGWH